MVPQSIEAKDWVHALSEYTFTFTVVIEPVDGRVLVELVNPEAITVKNNPVTTIAATYIVTTLLFFIAVPQ